MYKLVLVSAWHSLLLAAHHIVILMFEEQDHFHSCDGKMVYVEEPDVNCMIMMKEDIIEELRNSQHTESHDFHHKHSHQ